MNSQQVWFWIYSYCLHEFKTSFTGTSVKKKKTSNRSSWDVKMTAHTVHNPSCSRHTISISLPRDANENAAIAHSYTCLQTAVTVTRKMWCWHKSRHLTWTEALSCSLRSSHQTLWTSSGCRHESSHIFRRWCSEQPLAFPISKLETAGKQSGAMKWTKGKIRVKWWCFINLIITAGLICCIYMSPLVYQDLFTYIKLNRRSYLSFRTRPKQGSMPLFTKRSKRDEGNVIETGEDRRWCEIKFFRVMQKLPDLCWTCNYPTAVKWSLLFDSFSHNMAGTSRLLLCQCCKICS